MLIAILVKINFADSNVPVFPRIIISALILSSLAAGIYYLLSPLPNPAIAEEDGENVGINIDSTLAVKMPKGKTDTSARIVNPVEKANDLKSRVKKDSVVNSLAIIKNSTSKIDTTIVKQNVSQPGVNIASGIEKKLDDKKTTTVSVVAINADSAGTGERYRLKGKTFLYTSSNEFNRSDKFINYSTNTIVTPLNTRDGFIYVKIMTSKGKMLEGWLKQNDLELIQ